MRRCFLCSSQRRLSDFTEIHSKLQENFRHIRKIYVFPCRKFIKKVALHQSMNDKLTEKQQRDRNKVPEDYEWIFELLGWR